MVEPDDGESRRRRRLTDAYDQLVAKHTSLQSDYARLSTDYKSLKLAHRSDCDTIRLQSAMVVNKLQSQIDTMKQTRIDVNNELEQFKCAIRIEISNYYERQLMRISNELELSRKTIDDLLVERTQLNDRLTKKDSEIDEHIRKFDAAQIKSRNDIDEMAAIIDELTDQRQMIQLENELTIVRERLKLFEEQNRQLNTDLSNINIQKSESISELQRRLNIEEMEKINANVQLASLNAEIEANRLRLTSLDDELVRMRAELTKSINDRLTVEADAMQRERSIGSRFKLHMTSIDASLIDIEKSIEQKNRQINELQNELKDLKLKSSTSHELVDQQPQLQKIFDENNEMQLKEKDELIANLNRKIAEMEHLHMLEIRKIEYDRDRLELEFVQMRKDTTNVPAKQLNMLKNELKKKDQQQAKTKEHYRALLSRMKKSYRSVEKKLMNVQIELDHDGRIENRQELMPFKSLPIDE